VSNFDCDIVKLNGKVISFVLLCGFTMQERKKIARLKIFVIWTIDDINNDIKLCCHSGAAPWWVTLSIMPFLYCPFLTIIWNVTTYHTKLEVCNIAMLPEEDRAMAVGKERHWW